MRNAGGLFGLYVALTGERSPGGSVAMAEGNALGKGPVIFHLYDSGIAYIRQRAAGITSMPCHACLVGKSGAACKLCM